MTERIELAFGGVSDEASKGLVKRPEIKLPKIIGWYCPETRPDLLMPIYEDKLAETPKKPANSEAT